MASDAIFPDLTGWRPTRDTLHWYAKALGVVPRAHAEFHPKWWHISLKVKSNGLVTEKMSLAEGGNFWLRMDLQAHEVLLETSQGELRKFSLQEGIPATAFGDQILQAVADLGLYGEYPREKYDDSELRQYDPAVAEKYFRALVNIDRIFKKQRASLHGEVGPVQLWPHGFDLAFEWFGTRQMEYEEQGEVRTYPAQLNLGFSPGESSHPEPYFYSNPWPFETEELVDRPLPPGARWVTEGWQGTIFPYAELVGDSRAEERLLEYARRVYEICSPALIA